MKVIEVPEQSWGTQATCSTCDSVVLVELADLRYDPGSHHNDAGWKCPTCRRKNWIPFTEIPKRVQHVILDAPPEVKR
jgi:hypothetical protein